MEHGIVRGGCEALAVLIGNMRGHRLDWNTGGGAKLSWCAQYSGGSTGGAIAALSALRSALPLSAELAGSAFKIIHINLLQDRAIIREFKGAILI